MKEKIDYIKELRKAEKEEALKKECKKFKTYKGIHKPKCNDGNPCEA